ncbi:hypothetical protein EV426DRAFT_704895 [Tirmania nivea]|nr:hypothetical protein EV426DRAFT_704895 [Tirmania nivea]
MAGSSEASQSDSGSKEGGSNAFRNNTDSFNITTSDDTRDTRFLKGIGRIIREARERVGALADAQVQIIEQATDSELASWGVTREEAKDELRYDELERLGRIYKSAVVKRQNNNITTEKYWGPSWIKNFGECARVSAVLSFDKGLDLLTDILPRLRAEIQARIDTPRTNKERWVMVEDLKWVLEQDDLPPNLPLDE